MHGVVVAGEPEHAPEQAQVLALELALGLLARDPLAAREQEPQLGRHARRRVLGAARAQAPGHAEERRQRRAMLQRGAGLLFLLLLLGLGLFRRRGFYAPRVRRVVVALGPLVRRLTGKSVPAQHE